MAKLLEQKCIPCTGDLPPATAEEIDTYKTQIPDWNLITENSELRLQRVYQFPDFKSALAFTNQVGDLAEAQGHHPALLTEWGKVSVTWWTHALKALHHNDFIMAAKCDSIYEEVSL
ncbi:MAG: 4a-hydroxytetrahydrobiopterin dehydratase [Cyanobacteria bacterium P01_G01_bin.39]